jgi:hypothetical protein
VLAKVLSDYYRRQQIVRAEVIERTFQVIAGAMACYTSLPERWDITLLRDPTPFGFRRMTARWQPVASWQDAGADVRFANIIPPWCGDNDLRKALEQLGRPADRYTIESMGPVPSFEGYWTDGRSPSTTAIVRAVCSLLKNDIEYLFSQLPSHELIAAAVRNS